TFSERACFAFVPNACLLSGASMCRRRILCVLVEQDVDHVAVRDLDDLARERHRRIVSESRRDERQQQSETQPRHGFASRGAPSVRLRTVPVLFLVIFSHLLSWIG